MLSFRFTGPAVAGFLCVASAFLPTVGAAQSDRIVHVTGAAATQQEPDVAYITLGVRLKGKEAAETMRAVSDQMRDVVAQLETSGIERADIQTSRLSLNTIWENYRSGNDVREVSGFEASNTISLTIRDLDAIGSVMDMVLEAGANEFQGLRFDVLNTTALQDELRAAAVKDAIRKARQLAEASGAVLGPVREIRDEAGHVDQSMMRLEMASSDMPIAAGSVDLSHSVSVSFDLLSPGPAE